MGTLPQPLSRYLSARKQDRTDRVRPGRGRLRDAGRASDPALHQHRDHALSRLMHFEDIKIGDELPPLTKGPLGATHVMRWSAATENWHPLHFDWKYATQHDGLPDVLVSGSWKQHVLIQLLSDWAGETGWLLRFKVQL